MVIGLQTSSNGDETTIKLLTDAETRPLDTTTRGADVRSERGDRFRSTKRRANRAETLDAGRVARGRAELISDRSPEKKRAPLGENQKRTMTAMPKPRVRLSDDERKKFDSIGLDDINSMVDVAELHKLHRYME